MPTPPVVSAVPDLYDYQFAYGAQPSGAQGSQGFAVFGLGWNGVNWKEIDGLDVENLRIGDSVRPRDQGEFAGYDFLAGRDITVKFDVDGSGSTLQQNMFVLSSVMAPVWGATETPLYFALPYFDVLSCMAKPRNRSWKIDKTYEAGHLAQDLNAVWHATDPRFYSTPTLSATFAPGLPITNGLGGPNAVEFTNNGNIESRPRITLTGPAVSPGVACSAFNGVGLSWQDYVLLDGWQIAIDTYYQTVQLVEPTLTSTVAVGSDGEQPIAWNDAYPGTLDMVSNTGFASSGNVIITMQTGGQVAIRYSGKGGGTQLTGCVFINMTVGATGVLTTGDVVTQEGSVSPFSYQLYPGSTWFTLFPGSSYLSYYMAGNYVLGGAQGAGCDLVSGQPGVQSSALFGDIVAGMQVFGPGVPVDTTVLSVTNSSNITLSNNASHDETDVALTFGSILVSGVTTVNHSATVSVSSGGFPNVEDGMTIMGDNVPEGTTVVSISGNNLVMSREATGAGTTTLAFNPASMYVEWASAYIL